MSVLSNILLIEDDNITSLVCERVMVLAGFTRKVYSYKTVKEACIHIENSSVKDEYLPKAIFLDLHLGPYSGWDFLKWYANWARGRSHFPPVYILSSSLDEDDVRKSSAYIHVKGFIVKPVKISDLEEISLELAGNEIKAES